MISQLLGEIPTTHEMERFWTSNNQGERERERERERDRERGTQHTYTHTHTHIRLYSDIHRKHQRYTCKSFLLFILKKN
jgi:hypothetical protein